MKKVFLIITIALFSLNAFAQKTINTDDLIGYWKANEKSTQLFFWKNIKGDLQVQEISEISGDSIDLVNLEINNDCLVIDTIFKPNGWTIKSVFTFVDQNNLKRDITGYSEGTLYYTKIK